MAKKDKLTYAVDGAVVATNRKARFEYEILDKIEAGVVLVGNEVKSLRLGRASLTDAYGTIERGEAWLKEMHVDPYELTARIAAPSSRRPRKLLLHKRELARLSGKLVVPGCTLIPLRVYFKNGRAKVEMALARGKRQYDKRKAIQDRDNQRDMDRARKEAASH